MKKIKLVDEFEFISEKPLKANSNIDLSFGHKEIVSILRKIVKKLLNHLQLGCMEIGVRAKVLLQLH